MRLCTIAVALAGLLLIAIPSALFAQSILTIAGGGTEDGRPATVASLSPSGMALDAAGDLYIADTNQHGIRKVAAVSGIITTVAGNGSPGFSGDGRAATAAQLSSPYDVALDSAGNLYIADSGNNRIRKVAAGSGIITTVAGNRSVGFSGDGGAATAADLHDPSGVAVDVAGNLYIADTFNDRIRKVAAGSGIITTVAGSGSEGFSGDGGAATASGLFYPYGVAVDSVGNLYIADSRNDRIRRVAAGSGIITTVAGNGSQGFSGDGGAATAAGLFGPFYVALDSVGSLYIADTINDRIRKVAAGSGIITTVAGSGSRGFSGDGGAATAAGFYYPHGMAFDSAGNLYLADSGNHRVRRVAAGSGIISTVAGNGSLGGDNGPAISAKLSSPDGLALDSGGNLYIADSGSGRIRKVAAGSGIITTVAGNGSVGFSGDGGAATAASLYLPDGVALDSAGHLYIADTVNNRIRRVAAGSGIITTIAGNGSRGFSGDGGAATAASLAFPDAVALDAVGNVYIADTFNERIRKVAAGSGIITTVAGNGSDAFSGDGGAATAAGLSEPYGVALDFAGNLYIADTSNNRIRKVAAGSGIITTVAGNGSQGFSGDGGAATAARLNIPLGVTLDSAGNLYVADSYNHRIRKVAAGSGIITTVAGNGSRGFSGDGGVATAAGLDAGGVALDPAGNLYIADSGSNRVRAVFACVTVAAPALQQPANGSSSVPISPPLAWRAVNGAFHYDVYVDTISPPQKVVAADLAAPVYSPSNLEPLTTYYWKAVAKGDPFCIPFSSGASDVFSFTTRGSCGPPGAFTGTASGTTITWQPSAGASSYDLYLSTSNPPRSYATGLTELSRTLSGLAPGTSYSWKVVAHAACDAAQVAETSVGTFTTAGSCSAAGTFALNGPIDGEATVPATTLSWSASPGAASYDVYLGSGPNPPLYMSDLQQTSVVIPRLSPGAELGTLLPSLRWERVRRRHVTTCYSIQRR